MVQVTSRFSVNGALQSVHDRFLEILQEINCEIQDHDTQKIDAIITFDDYEIKIVFFVSLLMLDEKKTSIKILYSFANIASVDKEYHRLLESLSETVYSLIVQKFPLYEHKPSSSMPMEIKKEKVPKKILLTAPLLGFMLIISIFLSAIYITLDADSDSEKSSFTMRTSDKKAQKSVKISNSEGSISGPMPAIDFLVVSAAAIKVGESPMCYLQISVRNEAKNDLKKLKIDYQVISKDFQIVGYEIADFNGRIKEGIKKSRTLSEAKYKCSYISKIVIKRIMDCEMGRYPSKPCASQVQPDPASPILIERKM